MELLSKMLKRKASSANFSFHPKCEALGITHLCFADDLFILCGANLESMGLIKEALSEFEALSGLKPNGSKSNVFFCGVDATLKGDMLRLSGMSSGSLPMRYLGVPLISARLCARDCADLVERLTKRVTSWSSRFLSYAGRLQLVHSVLFGIQVYWASTFLLPKGVIHQVERILRNFLWTGLDSKNSGHKVKWEDLCVPKEEGGLGIKGLEVWNKAAMAKHVWSLLTCETSLWAKWVRLWLVRQESFWDLKVPSMCSWAWRSLLSLRGELKNHFVYHVNSGQQTFLWMDNWHEMGPLRDKFGERVIYDAGSNKKAKVADVRRDGEWLLPPASWELQEIIDNLPFVAPSSEKDSISWDASPSGKFSINSAWNSFRTRFPKVAWGNLLWGAPCIPRKSFILWVAIKRKLSLKPKLLLWGVAANDRCELCGRFPETLDHLFLDCAFSSKVWKVFEDKGLACGRPRIWEACIAWFCSISSGKMPQAIAHKLLFPALIHAIWLERNNRLFRRPSKPPQVIATLIFQDLKFVLSREAKKKRWDSRDIMCKIFNVG